MTQLTFDSSATAGSDSHAGVPATVEAGIAMSPQQQLDAIRRLFLRIEIMTEDELAAEPVNEAGEFVFDSLLGLNLFTEMTAHLGDKPMDLSAFPRAQFETFSGIQALVAQAYANLAARS